MLAAYVFIMLPRRKGSIKRFRDPHVSLSVCLSHGAAALGYRHAGKKAYRLHQLHPLHLRLAACSLAMCGQIPTPAPRHSVFLQAGCPTCRPTNSVKALIIINIFVWRHKVVTSEALGPGSVLLRKGKRESPGEEESL